MGGTHAFAFDTRNPPSTSLVSSVSGSEEIGSRGVVVSVRGDAELAGVRALVQVQALCARVRMSFKSPWLLLGLVVLAIAIGLWILADRRRARYTVRYTNVDVLATVVSGRSWLRYIPSGLVALGLAVLLVGLARPEVTRSLLRERATVILVVDTSRSMQAQDVEPTRLGAAQEALRTFLDQAPNDLRVGLIVFAGEAQVATPPTKDHALVGTAITDIDQFLVYGGTAIGDALQTAVLLGRQVTDLAPTDDDGRHGAGQLAHDADARSGELLRRREEPRFDPLPLRRRADERTAPAARGSAAREGGVLPRLHDRARYARRRHRAWRVRGHPGLTSSSQVIPVPPDPETLRAIAKTTGGEFSEARTAESLTRAYDNLGSRLGPRDGSERDHVALRGDRGCAAAARDRDRRVRLAAPALIRRPPP